MANRSVGGDHEGLDHPSRFVGPFYYNSKFVLTVKAWAQLRIVEVEADFTVLPNSGEGQHVIVFVGLQHVAVSHVGLDVNDRFVGFGLNDGVVLIEVHADHHGQPVHVGAQRAQFVGQFWWQHWQNGVRQIHRGCPSRCSVVKGGAGAHIVGHISDGYPERTSSIRFHQTDGIVEILGIGRVDGDQREVPQIGSSRSNLTVTVHLAQPFGMVDQRGIIGAWKWIVPVFSASL